MTDLSFRVVGVDAAAYAATPEITIRLAVHEATGVPVHAIALRCQVRIEPQRRGYDGEEADGVLGIFGDRSRWSETLRPFQWMQCTTLVQGFTGDTEVDLPLPCSYDFEVLGSRYLHAIREGEVPLALLFSGPVFTRGLTGFGVEQVPWDREARCRLPVEVWRRVMRLHYPNAGFVRLDHDTVTELERYRARHGLTSWEETAHHLLAHERDEVAP